MKKILHITSKEDWQRAERFGLYTTLSMGKEGFIHCSLPHQIPAVANMNFKGKQGLVLLEIEESQLKHEVRYEDLAREGQLFPHIYGALNLDAVTRVVDFPPQADGTFLLPSDLK